MTIGGDARHLAEAAGPTGGPPHAHAFGGALALAWCTERARGTIDIDVNVFAGVDVPFLSCADVAVFKAFFNRTRDWADLEEMRAAGTLDLDRVIGVLVRHLGADDERIARLVTLA